MKKLFLIIICLLLPLVSHGMLGEKISEQISRHQTPPIAVKKVNERFTMIAWHEHGFFYATGFLDGVSVFERGAHDDGSVISNADLDGIFDSYSTEWVPADSKTKGVAMLISKDGQICITYGPVPGLGENIITIIGLPYLQYILRQKSELITI